MASSGVSRRLSSGYVPVTPLGSPPQGEPALAPPSPPALRCKRCGTDRDVQVKDIDVGSGIAWCEPLCWRCQIELTAAIAAFLKGQWFAFNPVEAGG